MPRLPAIGADNDNWGALLNDFLRVSHDEEGKLRRTRKVLNVRDFGAQGDGATDDQEAIQSALTAVPVEGGTVFFPAGTYIVGETLTITNDRTTLQGEYGAAIIKAKDNTLFQTVISALGPNHIKLCDLVIDANQQGRSQTQQTVAISMSCNDSECSNIIVRNTIGIVGQSGVGIGVNGDRNRIIHCEAIDCGLAEPQQSDGFYISGTQNLLIGCIAKNCTDTGFVIETASHSGMIGCTALQCGAGAAITNASVSDAVGNFMIGVTIDGWSATVTGGIQIGITGNATRLTGNLVDTVINSVILTNSGPGPAVRVVSYESAITKGLILSNMLINGAGTQGVLFFPNTTDVSVTGGSIRSSGNTIQISRGCKNINIQGVRLYVGGGDGKFGIGIQDPQDPGPCDGIMVGNCIIRATDPQQPYSWGIYAFGTGANAVQNVRVEGNIITGYLNGAIGAQDPNVFLMIVQANSSAVDVVTLRSDFNALLVNLRRIGILQP